MGLKGFKGGIDIWSRASGIRSLKTKKPSSDRGVGVTCDCEIICIDGTNYTHEIHCNGEDNCDDCCVGANVAFCNERIEMPQGFMKSI